MANTHGEHTGSTKFYWLIGGFLAIVTIAEVAVTFIGLDQLLLVLILLVLSLIKGACVVMFFMHLRGDARVFKFLFISPLLLAISMILVLMAIMGQHVGIAG